MIFFLPLLSFLSLSMPHGSSSQAILGGFQPSNVVLHIVNFAVKELGEADGCRWSEKTGIIVENSESQVVAGTNYRFDLVHTDSCDIFQSFLRRCRVVVFESLQNVLSMDWDKVTCALNTIACIPNGYTCTPITPNNYS
eukprot:GFUD01121152.1.p1 GENE.GFUD01121152.1~~GFUD01121152.1.p1  ORF type:complete len:139 (-),score=16.50 GFUD01121152.1:103-519(-)